MASRLLEGARLRAGVGFLLLAGAAPFSTSCGTDARGIDVCRTIEQARCELAPACASFADSHGFTSVTTKADIEACKRFYRDQCLNGIENAGAGSPAPTQAQAQLCVAAIREMMTCAEAQTLEGCGGVSLVVPEAAANVSACEVLLSVAHPVDAYSIAGVEVLEACAFVATPPKAQGAGGGGGAASAGGQGGGGRDGSGGSGGVQATSSTQGQGGSQ